MKYIFKDSCIGVSIFRQAGASPTITLVSVGDITDSTANVNVSITDGEDVSKTGVEIDTDATFSNPTAYEENGTVTTIAVDNLTAETTYYVRGYVVWNGQTIYSSNSLNFTTESGSILPAELQACEYLEADGNSFFAPESNEFIADNIDYLKTKLVIDGNNDCGIIGVITPSPRYFFTIQLFNNSYTFGMFCDLSHRWASSLSTGTILDIDFDKNAKKLIVNNITQNLENQIFYSIPYYIKIFAIIVLGNPSNFLPANSGSKIWYIETNTFKLYPCYVKAGQTFTDNKGNVCSAGTCGMYDVVNQVFYTNDGTGTFLHGADINI